MSPLFQTSTTTGVASLLVHERRHVVVQVVLEQVDLTHLLLGRARVVISLLPGDSSADEGSATSSYKNRFAELPKLPSVDAERLMPQRREHWAFGETEDPDWIGFEGFITGREEIDRLARALSQAAADSEFTGS